MTLVKLSDADRVAETATDVRFESHPDWSDETLLFHPDEAKRVCVEVRRRLGKKVADDQILRAMVNARKRGKVRSAKNGRDAR